MTADIVIVGIVYFVTVAIHWNFVMDKDLAIRLLLRMPYLILFYVGFNILFKLYRTLWKYAGLYDILRFGLSSFLATGCV